MTLSSCASDGSRKQMPMPACSGSDMVGSQTGSNVQLLRVLGEHRYEVTDPVIASEAGEQGDADVHHAFGLRDHNRTPPEPRQPMPLARIVPLDAMGLVLARIELPDR